MASKATLSSSADPDAGSVMRPVPTLPTCLPGRPGSVTVARGILNKVQINGW